MDYNEAKTMLDSGRTENLRNRRKLANNTYLERRDDLTIAVKLHATDVVTFTPEGTMLNTGGWFTSTTKDRINSYSPLKVYSEKGVWYVNLPGIYGCEDRFSKIDPPPVPERHILPEQVCGYCDGTGIGKNWNGNEYPCYTCNAIGKYRPHGRLTKESLAWRKRVNAYRRTFQVPFFDGILISPDGQKVLRGQRDI